MEMVQLHSANLKRWVQKSKQNVMAIGFFDGIHQGHKEVIETAGKIAMKKGLPLTVMSFFPHPKTVLSNGKVDYLMPLSKKAAILKDLNVDTFYVVQFDKNFLSLSPEQFVRNYLLDMNVVHAVAGYDFSYGHKGAGKIERLEQDSSYQIEVTEVDKVDFQGTKISFTWTRELISKGEMDRLPNILGRFYETTCFWNGEFFELLPYYMLPGPGSYSIRIKNQRKSMLIDVSVPRDGSGVYLKESVNPVFYKNEQIEITWLRQLNVENRVKSSFVPVIEPFAT